MSTNVQVINGKLKAVKSKRVLLSLVINVAVPEEDEDNVEFFVEQNMNQPELRNLIRENLNARFESTETPLSVDGTWVYGVDLVDGREWSDVANSLKKMAKRYLD